MVNLCIITPTISRPTLARTLQSADLGPLDEWLVFGDGPQPEARRVVEKLKPTRPWLVYIETDRQSGRNGNVLRDLAIALSDKDYFVFMDDDDIFAPGAIETIKREIDDRPPAPLIFRMKQPGGAVIWQEMLLTPGNVGGAMFVVPNVREKLGQWAATTGHASDFNFIETTLNKWQPQTARWCGDIICICQPGEQ